MTGIAADLDTLLRAAVQHFWEQRKKQKGKGKKKDRGSRSAVTGGKHLDGLILLLRRVLTLAGIPSPAIYCHPVEPGTTLRRKHAGSRASPPLRRTSPSPAGIVPRRTGTC
jgi:hypothetical protein